MRISDWSSDVCSSDLVAFSNDRCNTAGRCEESSRLCANDLQIMLFVRVNAALGSELIDISLRAHGRCVGSDAQNLQRSILAHHLRRSAEQEVAYDNAGPVAPDDVRRLAAQRSQGRRVGKAGVRQCVT